MGDLRDLFKSQSPKKLLSVTFTFTDYSDNSRPQTLKDATDIVNHLEFQAKLLTKLSETTIAGHVYRAFQLEVSRTDLHVQK